MSWKTAQKIFVWFGLVLVSAVGSFIFFLVYRGILSLFHVALDSPLTSRILDDHALSMFGYFSLLLMTFFNHMLSCTDFLDEDEEKESK